MKAINMINVYRKYKGLWVAIEDPKAIKPKVVASGKTLKEALTKAQKKGYQMPLMSRIPKEIFPMVGSSRIISR